VIYQPFAFVPRDCPFCGYLFVTTDGHVLVQDELAMTEKLAGHDRRAHGGMLRRWLRGDD
jgi:hypothetical protein